MVAADFSLAITLVFSFGFATIIMDQGWPILTSIAVPYCCLHPLHYPFSPKPCLAAREN
jgi:hypothetical protein